MPRLVLLLSVLIVAFGCGDDDEMPDGGRSIDDRSVDAGQVTEIGDRHDAGPHRPATPPDPNPTVVDCNAVFCGACADQLTIIVRRASDGTTVRGWSGRIWRSGFECTLQPTNDACANRLSPSDYHIAISVDGIERGKRDFTIEAPPPPPPGVVQCCGSCTPAVTLTFDISTLDACDAGAEDGGADQDASSC
jgi:hypothetical protein